MRFVTHEDIELPIATVYAAVTDFDGFERAALRRGAEVIRRGDPAAGPLGATWEVGVVYRGKPRRLVGRVLGLDPPSGFRAQGRSSGLVGELTISLIALSPRRTRMTAELELAAETLAGRLLLQSLRLTRGSIAERVKTLVGRIASHIEARHSRPQPPL
jgi:hypothetical protein